MECPIIVRRKGVRVGRVIITDADTNQDPTWGDLVLAAVKKRKAAGAYKAGDTYHHGTFASRIG